jgi:hypothetical protein
MANKKFSSKVIERFDISFVTNPITKNSYIEVGRVPDNVIVTNGWAVIKTELGDADDGDNTTLAIGYDSNTDASPYPATAITNMNANTYLKLIPGVINIAASQAITTVDTPAEAVALGRVSGATFGGTVVTTTKKIVLSASNDQNIDKGTMTIWLEYLKVF